MNKKLIYSFAAIVIVAFIYSAMWIIVRGLVWEGFTTLQSAFARAVFAFFFLSIYFLISDGTLFSRLFAAPTKDKLLLILKGTIGFGFWAWLFSIAITKASFVSVSAMYLLPFVAFYWVVFGFEVFTWKKLFLILTSLFWAGLIIINDFSLLTFWIWELLALCSAAWIWFALVSRKRFSDFYSNQEITYWTAIVWSIVLLIFSLVQWWWVSISEFNGLTWIYMLVWWCMVLTAWLLTNFAFKYIKSSYANIFLNTELVRSILIWSLIYQEAVTSNEVIGSLIIFVCWIILILGKDEI